MATRISPVTGKPVRAYKKRGTAKAPKAAKVKANKAGRAPKREAATVRGGNRSGAGRKSSEVHFSQINAKIDGLAGMFGMLAEHMGLTPEKIAEIYTEPKPAEVPAPAIQVAPPASITTSDVQAATEAAPVKRKPGRPRKIVTTAPAAAAAEGAQPAPVFAPPAVAAPPVQYAPPVVVQQAPSIQPNPVAAAPVMQPGIPVTFSPPPPPPPVNPQFAVGVAPLNIQPVASVQQAPQQNGGPVDFEAQFQKIQQKPPNQ